MSYQITSSKFNTQQILNRILETDLVPSLDCIKNDAESILRKLEKRGLNNLEKIQQALKNKKKLFEIANEENIDENTLVLFRREIEGWMVKIRSIDDFDWLSLDNIEALKKCGVINSEEAYNKLGNVNYRHKISQENNIELEILNEIYEISNLMRIRWLSPNFTRIFYELNYSINKIQKEDAKLLCEKIDSYNKEKRYYKGKVGERDISRIIFESKYVE